jgi:predicted Zn-dependent protease
MSEPAAAVPFEPPDSFYFSAAQGWLELGNCVEAAAELSHLRESLQPHPDVLELRWEIAARRNQWGEALVVARQLVGVAPERPSGWLHQSYALRRVPGEGLRRAWEALLPVAEKFPDEPIVAYNLSCYACQLGELEQARTWFKRALESGGRERIRLRALRDPDLEPLWQEIRQL